MRAFISIASGTFYGGEVEPGTFHEPAPHLGPIPRRNPSDGPPTSIRVGHRPEPAPTDKGAPPEPRPILRMPQEVKPRRAA